MMNFTSIILNSATLKETCRATNEKQNPKLSERQDNVHSNYSYIVY